MSTHDGYVSFNPNEDQNGIYPRWERWLRGFELFVESKSIADSKRKKAMLLHYGGLDLQDVFFAIPGADELADGEDAYTKTKEELTKFFKPKLNTTFERHIFRGMTQKEGESVGQYVTRLRQQAKHCSFASEDDEIRDQVIEHCRDSEVRKRVLEKGDITLKEVLEIANAWEISCSRVKAMEGESVANLSSRKSRDNRRETSSEKSKEITCSRCGYKGHKQSSDKCPARDKECGKCKKTGHYASMCRTKNIEGNGEAKKKSGPKDKKKNTVRHVEEADHDDEDSEYAFALEDHRSSTVCVQAVNDEKSSQEYALKDRDIKVKIGGVEVEMLIDSGTTCNVMGQETWKFCKNQGIICESKKSSDKTVKAYGQEYPLELIGEFKCKVAVGNKETQADFIVTRGDGKALLGYPTAYELGILRVGLQAQINNLDLINGQEGLFEGIGKLKGYQLHIPVDKSVTPVAQPRRRIPIKLRDKVREQIDSLLEQGIIERVVGPTPWVSPAVPVIKRKTKEIRLCVDLRRVNKAVERHRYPLPVLEEILNEVKGSQWFSKLDIKSAFQQIELDEESRAITTFATDCGLFRFKRLVFGLNCAPECFQHILEETLRGLNGVVNFIDDILVFGKSKEEHDFNVRKVFGRLHERGFTLNKEKCEFRQKEIEFLGFKISGKGFKPLRSKIEAVENFREPKTPEEIRSFLGLVNFCAPFIPNLANVSESLRRLTRKNEKFVWGKEQDRAFNELKKRLCNAETLGIFDKNAKTRLVADASPVAIGAVLTQETSEGRRVISYASRSLTACERRYSQTEREALAIVYACERFHIWLYGIEFDLVTDHKALEFIFSPKAKPCARIERWVLRLQAYKYRVVYEAGKTNIADPLSRLVKAETQKSESSPSMDELYICWVATEAVPAAMSMTELETESANDPLLIEVREAIRTGKWDRLSSSRFRAVKEELCLYNNLVLRGTRIVIPERLKERTLALAHEGHPGIVAMKNRLRSKVWWDGIDKDAERSVKKCESCQLVQKTIVPAPLKCNELPDKPWDTVALDLLGPLPSGDHILIVVDYYSRFYEVEVLRSYTASVTISRLRDMFARHGNPRIMVCDNGQPFASAELREWAENRGIQIRHVAPYWPQANGEVERQNRSVVKRLKIAQIEKRPWKEELADYLLMYRSTPHTTTGKSPAEMLFGRKLRTKMPELIEDAILDEDVRDRDAWKKMRGKDAFDQRNHVKESSIQVGDTVLMKAQKTNKLSPEFDATRFTVTDKRDNLVTISSPQGEIYKRNVSAVKKPYHDEDDDVIIVEASTGNCQPKITPKVEPAATEAITPVRTRPERESRVPKQYKGFVMY